MSNVTGARVSRIVDQNNRRTAEVEIRTDDPQMPMLVAYVGKSGAGSFDIQAVYQKDADHLTDWFDNSFHEAYKELSNDLHGTADPGIEQFVLEAIQFGDVKAELNAQL